MSEHKHTIGTAWTDEYESSEVAITSGESAASYARNTFEPFAFCPHCGADVRAEARALAEAFDAIQAKYLEDHPYVPPQPMTEEERQALDERFKATLKQLAKDPVSSRVRKNSPKEGADAPQWQPRTYVTSPPTPDT
jgi:hypothetical protein